MWSYAGQRFMSTMTQIFCQSGNHVLEYLITYKLRVLLKKFTELLSGYETLQDYSKWEPPLFPGRRNSKYRSTV